MSLAGLKWKATICPLSCCLQSSPYFWEWHGRPHLLPSSYILYSGNCKLRPVPRNTTLFISCVSELSLAAWTPLFVLAQLWNNYSFKIQPNEAFPDSLGLKLIIPDFVTPALSLNFCTLYYDTFNHLFLVLHVTSLEEKIVLICIFSTQPMPDIE